MSIIIIQNLHMSRLLIYHNNVTSFDEFTKLNIIHPLELKTWKTCNYTSELTHIQSQDFFYLLLIEWLFGQQLNIKQNKHNCFIIKNKSKKNNSYRLLDYMLIFNIISGKCLVQKAEKNYVFYLRNIWSSVFDTFCRLNFDYNSLDSAQNSKASITIKDK